MVMHTTVAAFFFNLAFFLKKNHVYTPSGVFPSLDTGGQAIALRLHGSAP